MFGMTRPGLTAVCAALAVAGIARAEVRSSAPSGFVLKIETTVGAPPAEVYARFFEIARWWSGDHTYSGSAANLSLRSEPGGCFCESLGHGAFVRHASVEYAVPGHLVRLAGALGPLEEIGAYGMLAFHFDAAGQGTKLTVTYVVSGYPVDKGLGELAPGVDMVLATQVERLKRLSETGKPTA
jgi:uncharacterized protein YndB with AHSA1/START domain